MYYSQSLLLVTGFSFDVSETSLYLDDPLDDLLDDLLPDETTAESKSRLEKSVPSAPESPILKKETSKQLTFQESFFFSNILTSSS